MPEQKYSWEQLNAYVDGELSPPEASDVAAEAARDPQVAQAIATLTRLKATTRGGLETETEDAPSLRTISQECTKRRIGSKWPFALAAGVVLAAVVGTVVWYGLQAPESPRAWITAAEERHQEWLASASEVRGEDQPVFHETTGSANELLEISINGVTGYVPDLSLAGMRITRFSHLHSVDDERFFVGYLGENGCQLSLTIGPAPEGLENALSMERQDDTRATASWRVGDTAYAAVAHKMDRQRFEKLTIYLEEVTRKAGIQEKPLRTARNMQDESRPCLI